MILDVLPGVGDGRTAYDVEQIISGEAIETHFQPIVSIRRKSVVGIEALSRGIAPDGGLVPPNALFNLAAVRGKIAPFQKLSFFAERAV